MMRAKFKIGVIFGSKAFTIYRVEIMRNQLFEETSDKVLYSLHIL